MKGLYMLWNMVDGREKTELYQVYEAVMKEPDLPVLKTFLPDTKRFRREPVSYTHLCFPPFESSKSYLVKSYHIRKSAHFRVG